MAWEKLPFYGKGRPRTPQISVSRAGRIALVGKLAERFGPPCYVELLWDAEQQLLGVRKVTQRPGSFHLQCSKPGSWGFQAGRSLRAIGKIPSAAYRRDARDLGDGIWAICLDEMEAPAAEPPGTEGQRVKAA